MTHANATRLWPLRLDLSASNTVVSPAAEEVVVSLRAPPSNATGWIVGNVTFSVGVWWRELDFCSRTQSDCDVMSDCV